MFLCFTFREREFYHIHCLIIPEVAKFCWEKFSPFAIIIHFFYYLRNEIFVFFFRILFIEDTVLCILKSDTSEALMYVIHAVGRVNKVTRICPTAETKSESTRSFSDLMTFVHLVKTISPLIDIHTHSCISKVRSISELFRLTNNL